MSAYVSPSSPGGGTRDDYNIGVRSISISICIIVLVQKYYPHYFLNPVCKNFDCNNHNTVTTQNAQQ